MEAGFKIINDSIIIGNPTAIIVTNFQSENEVFNFVSADSPETIKAEKTKSDVGFWNIRFK